MCVRLPPVDVSDAVRRPRHHLWVEVGRRDAGVQEQPGELRRQDASACSQFEHPPWRPRGNQLLRRAIGDIETDYLNGQTVLLGRINGIATPANELLQRLARELAITRDAPGATAAAAILERLEAASKAADDTFV